MHCVLLWRNARISMHTQVLVCSNHFHVLFPGGGFYMYIESSFREEGDRADLVSPFLQAGQEYCLQMFTNMFGDTMGNVTVLVEVSYLLGRA